MKERAVVLLSGGLDSATLGALAVSRGMEVYALTVDYGQRCRYELEAAAKISARLGFAGHKVVKLAPDLFAGSALVGDCPVPDAGRTTLRHGVPETYVPARNTVLLSLALGWAETLSAHTVFIGANSLDYSGYPDCRPEFIERFNQLAQVAIPQAAAGGRPIRIEAPLMHMTKGEIVKLGLSLGVDYSLTVSCYAPLPDGAACGRCESCVLRLKGFEEAGALDPIRYAGKSPPAPYAERLEFAKEVAREAGELLMRFYGKVSAYDHKGTLDLVSEADRASEMLIRQRIAARFPSDAILAEESGQAAGDPAFTWMIDPLDGTTNFLHSHPVFAVSMAICNRDYPEAGVVYVPVSKELFYASRGMGAWLNSTRITVSSVPSLNSAILATGMPYNRREVVETLLEDWRRATFRVQGIRRVGAAAVDLVYLACGRYDGFWERGLKPWDTAAGMVIVEEAGGKVTSFSNGPYSPFLPEIVASNGKIHDELVETLFGGR